MIYVVLGFPIYSLFYESVLITQTWIHIYLKLIFDIDLFRMIEVVLMTDLKLISVLMSDIVMTTTSIWSTSDNRDFKYGVTINFKHEKIKMSEMK